MWQYKALNGDRVLIEVADDLFGFGTSSLPPGLTGVNYQTGLVHVQLTQTKKTEMKYGRFLVKAGKEAKVAREESCKLSSKVRLYNGAKLSLATTEEEICRVYDEGPHSCMSNSDSVRVYAGPDTAVAFVEVDGRILARSVVVINKDIGLQYERIYGNAGLMEPLLYAAGYEEGSINECRLLFIERDRGIVCPYLDCGTNVEVNAGYLVVTDCGEYSSQGTTGYIESCSCENCGDIIREDEQYWCEYREMSLCEDCYQKGMVVVNGDSYHEDSGEVKQTGDGDWILEGEACYSEYHGEYFHEDDVTHCEMEEDYFKNDEVCQPWDKDGYMFWAPKENCLWIRGVLVHQDDEEVYRNINDIGEDECPNLKQSTFVFAETNLATPL